MEIDLELTEKSAKNTQHWWKLTATIRAEFTIFVHTYAPYAGVDFHAGPLARGE